MTSKTRQHYPPLPFGHGSVSVSVSADPHDCAMADGPSQAFAVMANRLTELETRIGDQQRQLANQASMLHNHEQIHAQQLDPQIAELFRTCRATRTKVEAVESSVKNLTAELNSYDQQLNLRVSQVEAANQQQAQLTAAANAHLKILDSAIKDGRNKVNAMGSMYDTLPSELNDMYSFFNLPLLHVPSFFLV